MRNTQNNCETRGRDGGSIFRNQSKTNKQRELEKASSNYNCGCRICFCNSIAFRRGRGDQYRARFPVLSGILSIRLLCPVLRAGGVCRAAVVLASRASCLLPPL